MGLRTMVTSTTPRHRRGSGMAGFTLIELMVVVLIVAILGTIAYTSYANNVTATRRKAATACLIEQGQFMERYYTTRMTYVDANPALGCETELAQFYQFSTPGAANTTQTTYTITATPQGVQATRDTKCGTLGINQVGSKTKTGSGTVADCW